MDLQIKTHGFKLSDNLHDYITQKVSKLDRVNERVVDAKFEVRARRERSEGEVFIAQFTIVTPGHVLRSEERNHDQRLAIDAAIDKMVRQISKFHERRIRRTRRDAVGLGRAAVDQSSELLASDLDETEGNATDHIVRVKRFALKPMLPEEAVEQLDLLGHEFFVFQNAETAETNVVYRRNDGAFGLIEPELG